MRQFYPLFLVLSIYSCKTKTHQSDLFGNWTRVDVIDKTGLNSSDIVTFYGKDSMSIQMMANGKIVEKIFGTFKIDSASKNLTTAYGGVSFKFIIVELTKDKLILQKGKERQTYSRSK